MDLFGESLTICLIHRTLIPPAKFSCYIIATVSTYLAMLTIMKCDRICQNPPLAHTMATKVFHHQLIALSISYVTNCHNTTATSSLVCFFSGLFLRPVRHLQVLRCSLNATGWLVQAATLLKLPPDSFMMLAMVLAIFCDILSAMGPHSRLFHLENY